MDWGSQPYSCASIHSLGLTVEALQDRRLSGSHRELLEGSNGEQVIGSLLKEDLAYTLDATMFSATAASATRPAGLLNGLTTVGATTGGGVTALNADVAKLFTAISAVGSIDDIVLIASPSSGCSAFVAASFD